jgi:glycosyltransferase involved in cell wall biosynthesis
LALNPSILHIVKWFPHEADPQNGIFIQRHIDPVAPYADNYILFIREVQQTELMKVRKYHHMAGMVYEVLLSAKASGFQKHVMKIAALQHFLTKIRKPHLIHFHIATPDQAFAAFAARLKGIPYVVSEHWGGYLDERWEQLPFYKKWLVKTMLLKAKRVLVVSKYLMHGMVQAGIKANYRIVPNVVLVPELRQIKFPDFTFCVLADLADNIKNISGVIRAFAHHHKTHQNSRLEIIGGGPDAAALANLVVELQLSDVVVFHGRKPQEAATELLASCHCLVINSYRETFSVVGLEALSLGLPVIATKCGGPEEYLNNQVAILIPVADQTALEAAMGHMQLAHVLFASHVQGFDAARADLIVVMDDGKVVWQGPYDAFRVHPQHRNLI